MATFSLFTIITYENEIQELITEISKLEVDAFNLESLLEGANQSKQQIKYRVIIKFLREIRIDKKI